MRCLLWLTGCLLAVAPLRADEAADIARIHLEAIGGHARMSALVAMRMTGVVVLGGKRVKFVMIAARPDRVRLETENNGRTLVNATDGVEPPWEFDTGTWPPRYRVMSEAAARAFTADTDFDDPLVAGPERGFTLEYGGEVEVEGRKLLRVLVTRRLTETFSVLVDEETYFIVQRVETRETVAGRTRRVITRYDDFRPVDGVLLPHRVTLEADGRTEQTMIMERIETNPALTPGIFTRPRVAATDQK
jgi:hypothetical protein